MSQAVDTSVSIPLLVQGHAQHDAVVDWWSGRLLSLTEHSQAETYAVLTRLPGDLRTSPSQAARLITSRFGPVLTLSTEVRLGLPAVLADVGVSGGATYDALVALAAREHHCTLATRDMRALATYRALGAEVEVVG